MRALITLAIFIGVPYFGYKAAVKHFEKKAAEDMVQLERRTKELGDELAAALAKNPKLTSDEALEALARFSTSSGKVGGIAIDEFWDGVFNKGTFETVWPNTYTLKEKLYQAGPTFWPNKEKYEVKFSPKILENLRIGYVDATVAITGRGIPSQQTLDELVELMRQQGKLKNFIFYHGMQANIYMTMHWVRQNHNWYLDPDTPAAFKHYYRPQQKLRDTVDAP